MNAQSKGHLYIIQSEEGPVKIGISATPHSRIATIETGSGRRIVRQFISPLMPGYDRLESELHTVFKADRTVGEWFTVAFDDVVRAARLLGAMLSPESWVNSDTYLRGCIYRKRIRDFSNPDRTSAEWDAFHAGLGQEEIEMADYADKVDFEMAGKSFQRLDQLSSTLASMQAQLGIKPRIPASVIASLQQLRKDIDDDLEEAGL